MHARFVVPPLRCFALPLLRDCDTPLLACSYVAHLACLRPSLLRCFPFSLLRNFVSTNLRRYPPTHIRSCSYAQQLYHSAALPLSCSTAQLLYHAATLLRISIAASVRRGAPSYQRLHETTPYLRSVLPQLRPFASSTLPCCVAPLLAYSP